MRVFLDTNVLVSAVATRGLCADVLQAVLAEHELVIGETVLVELQRVLLQKIRLSSDVAEEMDEFLRGEAVVIADAPSLGIKVRDPNDVLVLEEACAGRADVLITGDKDLLELGDAAPVRVVTPRGFWEQLRKEGASE